MRIDRDADLCEGWGQCVHVAPELFDLDEDHDDQPVEVLNASPIGPLVQKAELAVQMCPRGALSLER